ncbi:hypothetical protein NBO_6g0044 [Nosema bombycis CQ1]|uniref:Uncharacterized protein n=1 Tax=Nosema bombycis (strain CQ1 / CVCC 102059) TaxID=578461 RepID=R0KYK6_NOSB1|nr:hypothetical protein NBO_6g0044 [Nosema bombycis CQ1]|eukprot:EOB15292.1 hypothetical protein NBO_6g0044 [Nosema bombycis CQ1]
MSFYYDHMFKNNRTMNFLKQQSLKQRLERNIRNKEAQNNLLNLTNSVTQINDLKELKKEALNVQLPAVNTSLPKFELAEKSLMLNQTIVDIKPTSVITVSSKFETKVVSKHPDLPISLTLFDLIILDLFFIKKSCKQVMLALPAPKKVSQDHMIDLRTQETFDKKDNPDNNKHETNQESQEMIVQSTEILNIESNQNCNLHESEAKKHELSYNLTETPTEVIEFKDGIQETATNQLESNFISQEELNISADLSNNVIKTKFKPNAIVSQDKLNILVKLENILHETESSINKIVFQDKKIKNSTVEHYFNELKTEPEPREMVLQEIETLNEQVGLNPTLFKREKVPHKMVLQEKETLNEQVYPNPTFLEIEPEPHEMVLQEKETLNEQIDLAYVLPLTESKQHKTTSISHGSPFSSHEPTFISPNSSSFQPIPSVVSDETELTQSRQEDDSTIPVPIIRERMFNYRNIKSFWEELSKQKK